MERLELIFIIVEAIFIVIETILQIFQIISNNKLKKEVEKMNCTINEQQTCDVEKRGCERLLL